MGKKIFCIITGMFFLFLILETVYAAGIVGVSPGNVYFNNVLRGGYASRYITVTLSSDEPVLINYTTRGDIEDWIEFPSNSTVSKNNPGRLLLEVRPPSDMPNGNYTGFLRISTESIEPGGVAGHATGNIIAVIDVAITIEVTDVEILRCKASGFEVRSVEKGDDIIFNLDVLNEGNIRLKPVVIVDIWDQDQISIVKSVEFKGSEILPTKEEPLTFNLGTNDLDLDQYWVDINVPDCFSEDTLTFDVLEPGALKANGVLMKIFGTVWADVDDTIPIIANFKNIGEKDVDAYFKGQITQEGKIIQILESEKADVPISEIMNFTFFFTPRKGGKYIASGRVFYDKKRTFEASTVINVKPKQFGLKQVLLILVYAAVIVSIIFLFYRIRKEKIKYLRKIKEIKNEL